MWAGTSGRADALRAAVESCRDWWLLAGVDQLCTDEPVSWLERARAPVPGAVAGPQAARGPEITSFPERLADLQRELGRPCELPGASGARTAVPPLGIEGAAVMVVGDCPSQDDERAGRPLSGTEGRLTDAMLRAIGIDPDAAYRALTASCRPASGRLSPEQLAACGALLAHHIALARPGAVILLGATPARALLGSELGQARGRLHDLKHHGVSMPLVVTHHPRTMLRRPELKAQAWADLLLLMRTLRP